MCSNAAATRSFKFMIFITFESRDNICPKIENNWFLFASGFLPGSPGREKKNPKWIKKSRSSCSEVFYKKDVLQYFAQFTGKHLCWRLFLKNQKLRVYTIYWNDFLAYERLILLYYFHQKMSTEKTAVWKKIEAATRGVPWKRGS